MKAEETWDIKYVKPAQNKKIAGTFQVLLAYKSKNPTQFRFSKSVRFVIMQKVRTHIFNETWEINLVVKQLLFLKDLNSFCNRSKLVSVSIVNAELVSSDGCLT